MNVIGTTLGNKLVGDAHFFVHEAHVRSNLPRLFSL